MGSLALGQTIAQHCVHHIGNFADSTLFAQYAITQPEEDVHPHDRPGMGFIDRTTDLTARFGSLQTIKNAVDGSAIMRLPGIGGDEFGFVDDPVDFLMLPREGQEGGERPAFLGAAQSGDKK